MYMDRSPKHILGSDGGQEWMYKSGMYFMETISGSTFV